MKADRDPRELLSVLTGVPVESIPSDASISTFPDWDSIVHMELILKIEAWLSRPLTDDEMFSLISLDGITKLFAEDANGTKS
ncbi:MAG: hypothetical protein RIE23_05395 [Pontimonas sp.]